MSHTIRMLLGCLLPLALIFVLPLFGVSSGTTLLVFIVLMFLCHLLMMGGHGHGGHGGHGKKHGGDSPDNKKESDDERSSLREHHQH